MKILLFLFCCLSIGWAQYLPAQFCTPPSDKAKKLFEKGTNRKSFDRPERLEFLRKAALVDTGFAEAYLAAALELVGRCKTEDQPFSGTIPFFKKSIALCPFLHSDPYYYIGMDYYEQRENDSALKYLQLFVQFSDTAAYKFSKDWDFQIKQAQQMVQVSKMETRLKRNVVFNPVLITGVSTERDEYLAYVSPDDDHCFFVRRTPELNPKDPNAEPVLRERFMKARRLTETSFDEGEPMPSPFNSEKSNQGSCTISIDNKQLFFAMNAKSNQSQGNVDLFYSSRTDSAWSEIKNLGALVNDAVYWDSQPSLSPDGNQLFFASNRPGGMGGIDLYVSNKQALTGIWGKPQNLGSPINSAGDEKTPFIHPDGESFYFSSNGHPGFGGYDIFYCRKTDKGWSEPENLGYPINGASDDAGFFVSSNGRNGYFFSSDPQKIKTAVAGGYDLFQFELYESIRAQEMKFVRGQTRMDSAVLKGAQVQIKDLKTKKITYATVDTSNGEFTMAIKKNTKVMITVKKDNVAFNSFIIDGQNSTTTPVKIETQKLVKNGRFVLDNIYYRSNSAEIDSSSFIILESLAEYLLEHKEIKIEIGGHTDNVGGSDDNLQLSKNRANAVRILLINYGIPQDRISSEGYGASRPVAKNSTAEGRAKNRRTEFSVTQL